MHRSVIIFLCALVLTTGCQDAPRVEVPEEAIIRLSDQFSSDFELIDYNGAAFSSAALNGKLAVVYFGFASCPDVCPLSLGTLSAALNELNPGELAQLQPVFITVDPERDTPDVLKAYLSSFHASILGLTGSVEALDAARQSYKVYASREALPDSALGYTMNHTSLFYLIDRSGTPIMALRDTLNAQQLAEMLRRNI